MSRKPAEIICSACGHDSLLLRSPKYDGFTKIGETLACSSCGHEYENEDEVPFKEARQAPSIFSDADRTEKSVVFSGNDGRQLCRHCQNYVVNPFTQRCGLHMRAVEATDSCAEFMEKDDEAGA
jgi:uncharacterized protein (DUF983 family)